jgi:hypothetical protein
LLNQTLNFYVNLILILDIPVINFQLIELV